MTEELKYDDVKCQRFNDSLDVAGDVSIANISFQRSRILFELATESYKEAFADFLVQEYQELKQTAFDAYPASISYNFRLSEKGEGATDPVRKLLHLKDSWESIVFVLYALVMGEVRNKKLSLKAAQVFVSHDAGGNPVYASFNTNKILSAAIKQKIQNIKAIVQYTKANSLGFKSEEIETSIFVDLLQLQDIRNDISHHAAPTREQAEEELKQVIPLFQKMLIKTKFLENCKILRFESYTSACRCESFNGHSLNREYDNFSLSDQERIRVLGFGQEHLFVLWDTECFSLSPFLHFDKDATGHESYLCHYKDNKHSKYWYEPIKIRTEKTFDHLQSRFEAEIDEIINLVKP